MSMKSPPLTPSLCPKTGAVFVCEFALTKVSLFGVCGPLGGGGGCNLEKVYFHSEPEVKESVM